MAVGAACRVRCRPRLAENEALLSCCSECRLRQCSVRVRQMAPTEMELKVCSQFLTASRPARSNACALMVPLYLWNWTSAWTSSPTACGPSQTAVLCLGQGMLVAAILPQGQARTRQTSTRTRKTS